MKKLLITIAIFILPLQSFAEEEIAEIKMLIYWHVYEDSKNIPINNLKVFIKKNWEILWTWKTNTSWFFEILTENKSEFLNLCVQSTTFSENKNIDFCETISVFQNIWRIIDWVEIRELEHNFFTNKEWQNINEALEDEITNDTNEYRLEEYQENINYEIEQNEIKEAENKKTEELKKLNAKYKMPNNTEMAWPLKSIHIFWTIDPLRDENWKPTLLYNKTKIEIISHEWKILKTVDLWQYYDFNFFVFPKNKNKIFLNPPVFKIKNRQIQDIENTRIDLYQPYYQILTKEKEIINLKLEKKDFKINDKIFYKKESPPFLLIIFLFFSVIMWIIIYIKNKIYIKNNDF